MIWRVCFCASFSLFFNKKQVKRHLSWQGFWLKMANQRKDDSFLRINIQNFAWKSLQICVLCSNYLSLERSGWFFSRHLTCCGVASDRLRTCFWQVTSLFVTRLLRFAGFKGLFWELSRSRFFVRISLFHWKIAGYWKFALFFWFSCPVGLKQTILKPLLNQIVKLLLAFIASTNLSWCRR